MNNFEKYASYYNAIYSDKNYRDEALYVKSLIDSSIETPAASLLNIGCGTGNHDAAFATEGYAVTGIDQSAEMINTARQKYPHIEFLTADARTLNLNRRFDVVVSLFHVASYMASNADFEAFAATAAKHLNTGGVFIFDFWYGPAVLTHRPEVRIKRIDLPQLEVTRIAEPVIHANTNIVDVNYEIILRDKSSEKTESFTELHPMRYWFLPELQCFLQSAGFSVVNAYKWLTLNELSFDSWYGVVVGRKDESI